MPRTLTIIAAGEALLDETGEKPAPGGLAMRAALHAVRLGHVGIAVSRVGQDDGGTVLLNDAKALGIDVDHVQHDPDLHTGRRWPQRFGGSGAQIDERAAFDNLQWDHDLVDLAMRSHVMITGALARRSGQTRAEIDRFVSEGRTALKVFDLVNRDEQHFERYEQLALLQLVDGVVVDRRAMDVLAPTTRGKPALDAARELMREFKLEFAVTLNDSAMELVTPDDAARHDVTDPVLAQRELVLIALMHFVAHGCALQHCVERAAAIVEHTLKEPDSAVPESLRAVS